MTPPPTAAATTSSAAPPHSVEAPLPPTAMATLGTLRPLPQGRPATATFENWPSLMTLTSLA